MNPDPSTRLPAMDDTERFKLFVAGVADYAIYMLTPDGYINSWNAGAQRFKGYTADEVIGQHFSRFYTEEDRATGKPARALQTALQEGKFEEEGWRVRKDGTRFWASVVIDPIRDTEGRLIAFAKITRDITERKMAQEALRASEERFRLLVHGVTDYAIYMLSPTGEITNWNQGAERIKGYAAGEVIGTHFSRFYTEEDRASGLPERALRIATEEGRFEHEGWRVRKDGTRFWAHVVIDAIRDDLGRLAGFAKITRDITERRDAAATLERAKEALFQSQKLEAIGQLTGGIAHDFNNLLGVIVSGIELLTADAGTSPNSVKVLDSMLRAATRGATLTQQLLSFARKQPLRQSRHDLNRVIDSFEAVLRRASNESIAFGLKLEPALAPVMIDAAQFEAALLNLISNARDAMPEGGTLTVSTANVELQEGQMKALKPGRYVRVRVSDTGTGMSEEVMERAIEPFFTTKEPGRGTGMGLSQVYGLAQQCGGDIVLESAPGQGAEVSIYLPALDGDVGEDGWHEEPAAGDKGGKGDETPIVDDKALIVDDEPNVLEVTIELFQTMGYDVLSASNGGDAIEILKRTPDIDVLFTDVRMPGMSGVVLAREARKLAPRIKVVLASGYPAQSLSDDHPDFGEFTFVSKPYRTAEIMKLLRKAG